MALYIAIVFSILINSRFTDDDNVDMIVELDNTTLVKFTFWIIITSKFLGIKNSTLSAK